jgi:hypothetical protein
VNSINNPGNASLNAASPPCTDLSDGSIDTIVNSINEGKCVLFLGPMFGQTADGQKIHDTLLAYLLTGRNYNIDQEFPNLFILADNGDRRKAELILDIRKYYKTIQESPIYTDILKIKFRGIVNCTGDMFLENKLGEAGISHKFAYYNGGPAYDGVTGEDRLNYTYLYNVFGNCTDSNSVIIDYNRFYNFLIVLLGGTSELPSELVDILSVATVFLFVGFDLSLWYVPLILRKLYKLRGEKKDDILKSVAVLDRTIHPAGPINLARYPMEFEMEKQCSTEDLFDIIINHSSIELREVVLKQRTVLAKFERAQYKTTCDRLYGENKMDELLDLLQQLAEGSNVGFYPLDITKIRGRIAKNEDDRVNRRILNDAYNVEFQLISESLLNLIGKII